MDKTVEHHLPLRLDHAVVIDTPVPIQDERAIAGIHDPVRHTHVEIEYVPRPESGIRVEPVRPLLPSFVPSVVQMIIGERARYPVVVTEHQQTGHRQSELSLFDLRCTDQSEEFLVRLLQPRVRGYVGAEDISVSFQRLGVHILDPAPLHHPLVGGGLPETLGQFVLTSL